MMGEDIRFHSEIDPGRRFVFLGKAAIYSAGTTFMSFFARCNRYFTRGARLMIHERKLSKELRIDGPLTTCIATVRATLHEIEASITIQDEGFEISSNGEKRVMASGKFVSYLRVSTERQGRSGLGLEAQRSAVEVYLNGGPWTLIAELVEVESGKRDNRPKLSEAMALCRVHGATLVIAKLDRLSRDAAFLMGLQKAGVRFVAADMPEANETMVGFMALMAQAERKAISVRTKAALAEAKKRGVVMGGFRGYVPTADDRAASARTRQASKSARGADLAPILRELQGHGVTSLGGLARALTAAGIPTARGASAWSPMQVSRLLATMDGLLSSNWR